MSKLNRKKAIKLIGKETPLVFSFTSENMYTYETVTPTTGEEFLDDSFIFTVTVFNNEGGTFFKYEKLEDLIRKSNIINIATISLGGQVKVIYTQLNK
tara:strand:+ start:22312 stop:22605 length:294 start_codon:yes stop_codon:yes gene_type:complete